MGPFDHMTDAVVREFGREPVTFQPWDRASYPVPGIFSATACEASPGGVMITSNRPNLFLARGSLHRIPTNRDRFEIRGEPFRVIDANLDEEGGVTVELQNF